MTTSDSSPVFGKGALSTLRGKITASILVLLTFNAIGMAWLLWSARSAIETT